MRQGWSSLAFRHFPVRAGLIEPMTTVRGPQTDNATVAAAGDGRAEELAQPGRISQMLRAIAEIGADGDAISRLAFTKPERQAHRLVAGWLDELDRADDAHDPVEAAPVRHAIEM